MDSKISIGDKLDLKKIETRISADPEKPEKVYVSQVLDESATGDILVSMPIQEGKVIPLSLGQVFFATFYTKAGLMRCKVEVIGRYKKGALFLLELEQQTELEKVQRREYFRLECRMPIEYRIVEDTEYQMIEDGIAYDQDELDLEWKNAIMLDLSGGGIRFVSPFKEEKDSIVQVRLDISVEDSVEIAYAFASLIRSERNSNNPSIYDNRIMFWKMDKGMRERIIRFIFNTQRKKRSKEAGME